MRTKARIDNNQKEVTAALRKAGAVVLILSQLKNCFDILVFYMGQVFCMELKDGNKPPSARKLTEGEQKFKEKIEAVNVTYYVVNSAEEALDILNNAKK